MRRLVLIIAVLVASSMGCVPRRQEAPTTRIGLLHSKDGIPYESPSLQRYEKFKSMSRCEQRDEANRLARILEEGRGYARVVAFKVLFYISTDEGARHALTPAAARSLIKKGIRLSDAYSPTTPRDLAQDPDPYDELSPCFMVCFDVESFIMYEGRLPHGWKAVKAEVLLDGEVLPHRVYALPFERFGTVGAGVSDRLRSELGRHTIVYRLDLEAPNGTVETAEQKEIVYVLPDEPLDHP
jgi:hypothetical protein